MASLYLCGCYWVMPGQYHRRHYLTQVNAKAHTTIFSTASRTTLRQTFISPKFVTPTTRNNQREMRYTFPLYDGISVVGFVCRIGDRVITGEVQERGQARNTYEEAVSQGQTAAVLEQMETASDVFTCSIGNVAAGETIIVDITYVGELKHDSEVDGIRFTIPTSIAPRYANNSQIEVHPPDNVEAQECGFEVTVDAEFPDGAFIREMRSPTHPVAVSLGTTSIAPTANPVMNRASATLSLGSAELDKDFVLQVVAKEAEIPKALLETHPTIPGQRALMATLVPKFALTPERPELVFVCDRSGSMGGFKIHTLVDALKVFLKSLPTGVKFNICSFGSSHSFLWDKSKLYSQSSLNEAIQHVETFSANFGGTEMLTPVKDTLNRRYKDMPLDVFLVTDGQIWNSAELFNYLNDEIQVKKAPVRIFTLGIGNDVSHSLIEGVARAGNGFSQAVGNNEKFENKVVRMLKAGLTPHITDYTLEVKYDNDVDDFELVEKVADSLQVKLTVSESKELPHGGAESAAPSISLFDTSANPDAPIPKQKDKFAGVPAVEVPQLLQTPQQIPPLYPFTRTAVYIIMAPTSNQKAPTSVILRGTSPQGPLSLEIPVSILTEAGTTIHQLAARKAIQELEEGRGWLTSASVDGKLLSKQYPGRFADMVEREAVRLGVKFQIQSRWTSFVAVNKDRKQLQTGDKVKEYDVLDDADEAEYEKISYRSNTHDTRARADSNRPGRSMYDPTIGDGSAGGSVAKEETAIHRVDFFGAPLPSTAERRRESGSQQNLFGMAPKNLDVLQANSAVLGKVKSAKKSASPFGGIGSGISRSLETMFGSANRSPAPHSKMIHMGGPMPAPSAPPMQPALMAYSADKARVAYGAPAGGLLRMLGEGGNKDGAGLHALIALQTFEGFWKWGNPLFEACGLAEKDVKALYASWMGGEDVLATALAIRYLEVKLQKEKDTWELIVEKARTWVQSKVGDEGLSKVCGAVDALIATK